MLIELVIIYSLKLLLVYIHCLRCVPCLSRRASAAVAEFLCSLVNVRTFFVTMSFEMYCNVWLSANCVGASVCNSGLVFGLRPLTSRGLSRDRCSNLKKLMKREMIIITGRKFARPNHKNISAVV